MTIARPKIRNVQHTVSSHSTVADSSTDRGQEVPPEERRPEWHRPAVCCGFRPTPSSVMMAEVAGGTLNSSAANLSTAVNGVFSGTLRLAGTARVTVSVTAQQSGQRHGQRHGRCHSSVERAASQSSVTVQRHGQCHTSEERAASQLSRAGSVTV